MDRPARVWFKDKQEVFLLGEVVARKWNPSSGETDVIHPKNNRPVTVKIRETQEFDSTHLQDADDIANLNNLNSAPLLNLLRRRFDNDQIYTYVSDMVVSVNPFKHIPGLYNDFTDLSRYGRGKPPHTYSVAGTAFTCMMESRFPQSVIVNGESGAGKTEACKQVMQFLAQLSSGGGSEGVRAAAQGETQSLEQKVMKCNPILEAFGNAKTPRNDNSSRFGKFIKIFYETVAGNSSGSKIIGAAMCHYLLEKSRVVFQTDKHDRNYHVFLQLLAGADDDLRGRLELAEAASFKYLQRGCVTVDTIDDSQDFLELLDAFTALGVTNHELEAIWNLVAGILHAGNIEFCENPAGNSAVDEDGALEVCGSLLGCANLPSALTSRILQLKGRQSIATVNLKVAESISARDALSKAIYDRLFAWLVEKCNVSLDTAADHEFFIGILDIFGFEHFEKNSFEQLCINFANEKLQLLFNDTIFEAEKEVYLSEGLDCTHITFNNNQGCVDLIERKPDGIIPRLNEVCALAQDLNDMNYLKALNKEFQGKNSFFGKFNPKLPRDVFVVHHFAAAVQYSVSGFIEKNGDKLLDDLQLMGVGSEVALLKEIFEKADQAKSDMAGSAGSKRGKNKQAATIGFKFTQQLNDLNATLRDTRTHYIRCIKPNTPKKEGLFEAPKVMDQLTCSGVLEVVKIRKMGYPRRETWDTLWDICVQEGYPTLAGVPLDTAPQTGVRKIFQHVLPATDDVIWWQMGHTKVFLKDPVLRMLKDWKLGYKVDVILRRYRMWIARKRYRRTIMRIKKVQKCAHGYIIKRRYAGQKSSATQLQAWSRGFIVRRKVKEGFCATVIQALIRGVTHRAMFRRNRAASQVQRLARGRKARRHVSTLSSCRTIQRRFRGYKVRRELTRHRCAEKIQKGFRRFLFLSLWRKFTATRLQARTVIFYFIKMSGKRRTFLVKKRKALVIQRWVKWRTSAWRWTLDKDLRTKSKAAFCLQCNMMRFFLNRKIDEWVQDVLSAISWNNVGEIQDLLECSGSEYAILRETSSSDAGADRDVSFRSYLTPGWHDDLQRQLQKKFDRDGDGVLSDLELRSFVRALGILHDVDVDRTVRFFKYEAREAADANLNSNGDLTVRGLANFYVQAAEKRPTAVVLNLKSLDVLQVDKWVPRKATGVPNKVNIRDRMAHFKTFMHAVVACESVNIEIASLLLHHGFLVQGFDADHCTLMHKCAEGGDTCLSIATLLLEAFQKQSRATDLNDATRIFLNERNHDGKTALEIAVAKRAPEMASFLHQVGGSTEMMASRVRQLHLESKSSGGKSDAAADQASIRGRISVAKRNTSDQSAHVQFFMLDQKSRNAAAAVSTSDEPGDPGQIWGASGKEPSTPSARRRHNAYQERVRKSKTRGIFRGSMGEGSQVEDLTEAPPTVPDANDAIRNLDSPSRSARLPVSRQRSLSDFGSAAPESAPKPTAQQSHGRRSMVAALPSQQSLLAASPGSRGNRKSEPGSEEVLDGAAIAASRSLQPSPDEPASKEFHAPNVPSRRRAGSCAGIRNIQDPRLRLFRDSAVSMRRLVTYASNQRTEASKRGWYYLDSNDEKQGPYPSKWMKQWYQQNHFYPHSLVCMGTPPTWFQLCDLFPEPGEEFDMSSSVLRVDAKKCSLFLGHRLWEDPDDRAEEEGF